MKQCIIAKVCDGRVLFTPRKERQKERGQEKLIPFRSKLKGREADKNVDLNKNNKKKLQLGRNNKRDPASKKWKERTHV